MPAFDPRITPARPDLAAEHLRGEVVAARFAEGVAQEVITGLAPVRRAPLHEAALLTEALRGDRVTVYETDEEGWAWGQLASDGYVGWLPSSALLAPGPEPTHKVMALRTLVFPGPSIKLPPIDGLPLGSQVSVAKTEGQFAVTATGGYLPLRHLAPLASIQGDHVAIAERFLNAPYLWGGKSSLGIDCSGLVQVALSACGIACPRDSDMQEKGVGAPARLDDLRRGDLIFWKGHVAIARDASSVVHANAYHMQVVIESAANAIGRIAATSSSVTSVRRPIVNG